ncbi:MAG TPA: sigma-54 dependent transcriptional regulator [Dissulfurispiraceae bacterium]|nr:sigma-54 dependent transcriptional regulator [Dissulfurispiraceae bacterium]
MSRNVLLIVDDKHDMLGMLRRLISRELDVDVLTADNGRDALKLVSDNRVNAVLADIKMPGMDGMELLRHVKERDDSIVVVMMTAYGTVETAVESLKSGAYDFITKPFEEERLLHAVAKALEHNYLIRKNLDLEKKIRDRDTIDSFVGQSAPMRRLVETIQLIARTDVTVLITGETGTGKDLTAEMLHKLSNRSDKPFVAVNCPAIPENILESELFGYRQGAFTGATHNKEGLFESADGGTILLDEIGDITPTLQSKLLRVLQEKEIKPLGDTRTRKIDVRVISSTNQNLPGKIASGQFREDLYYRLNVVSIHTPSLRDMPEDIPLIADHFLYRYCAESGISQKKLSENAVRMLIERKWNGNVRELQNEIKRAVIFSKGNVINPEDFSNELLKSPCPEDTLSAFLPLAYKDARKLVLEKFNVQYISRLLKDSDGNISLAAKKAGIERQSLQHLMRTYGISGSDFRKGANNA